ncbi:MAG: hypothetical protein JKY60_12030 [Kordiimonadaceae bacterium]|nr:hypothetical protein [Kordiimonadaceae bacterium]
MRFFGRHRAKPIKKTDVAAALAAEGLWPISLVAEAMKISQSNLYDQIKGKTSKRGPYRMPEDRELAADIRRLVDVWSCRAQLQYFKKISLLEKKRMHHIRSAEQ